MYCPHCPESACADNINILEMDHLLFGSENLARSSNATSVV
jgi:hypothetical protein